MIHMSTNKSNKPELRFKGFSDDWEQRKFSDVFTGLQNNTLSRSELNYESGTVKNVHYGDVLIKFGDYIDASKEELPFINDDSKVENFKGSFLHNGDIVIADTAEDETVGKCTEIQGVDDIKLISGLHTIPCRPKEEYGAKFLGYYMNSSAYHAQLIPLMQGIKVTSISKSALQDTNMIIPKSVDEQTIIGEYFSNLDHLITLHQRKYDNLKIIKKSMLDNLFPKNGEKVPKWRFKGFNNDWEQRKLSDIYNDIGNAFVGTATPYYVEKGHFYLESNNVKDGQINHKTEVFINDKFYEMQKAKWLHTGDMVMVQSGHVGHAAVIPKELNCLAAHALIMFRNPKVKIEPYFLNYQYQTNNAKKKIENITTGNTIKHILASDMQEFGVDVALYREQEKIAKYFRNLDNLITLHQSEVERLKKVKQFFLKKMFV